MERRMINNSINCSNWSSSYALGLFFLFLVAIIWTSASIIVSVLFKDGNFNSPFLLTYISSSLFILLLIPWGKVFIEFPRKLLQCRSASSIEESVMEDSLVVTDHLQHIRIAAIIAPIWFASNWAYDMSLKFTTISSSTVLSSTGSLFTFLFAILSKEETFTKTKFVGVILCVLGSILTTVHDFDSDSSDYDSHNGRHLWGDVSGLAAAIGYGAYTVIIRKTCHPKEEGNSHSSNGDDTNNTLPSSASSTVSMALVFGYIGAWLMLALGPIALLQIFMLHSSAVPSRIEMQWIVMNGILDNVISDYLWARAVILTSATVATVGVGLTIPMAFLSDYFILKKNLNDINSLLGALAVLLGFLLVNLSAQEDAAPVEYSVVREDASANDNEIQLQTQHGERNSFNIDFS